MKHIVEANASAIKLQSTRNTIPAWVGRYLMPSLRNNCRPVLLDVLGTRRALKAEGTGKGVKV